MTAERRLVGMGVLLLAAAALYLGWNLRAPMGFILGLRAERLAALVMVGAASGAATMVFQTLIGNRLLTPGIIGFDALYIFLQTLLVLVLGGAGFSALAPPVLFAAETACLMGAALVLFGLLLRRGAQDLVRLVLTGVILGVLLRGLASFAQRLLEPSEFAVVQQASVASFNAVEAALLPYAGIALALSLAVALTLAPALDVAALGRIAARTLGLGHDRLVMAGLVVVAALVAVSTALVGPMAFLGLLAASLAQTLLRSHRHALLIPAAAMTGAVILVLGQFLFERLLGLQSALAIVVEFLGGLVFLTLVLKRRTR